MDLWLIVVVALAASLVLGFVVVIVRGRAEAVAGPAVQTTATSPAAAVEHGDSDEADLDASVRRLVGQGHRIQAIKVVRERTRLDLARAKSYVDRIADGASPAQSPPSAPEDRISADAMARVQALAAQGKIIPAVKELRQHTGLGLREAKDLVDRMTQSAALAAVSPPAAPAVPEPAAPAPDEVMARVRQLAAQGRKIHAIKELRQHTSLSLKEAKDLVDGF
ncbi:ribosomal protein L7/L12 [Jiangella asiatica]|uniref:Large ribosomal subunit protein bL12 C-terminal domain-containing protein n=1 Tax=Jiangella asiatica TaxID=2530372 RepID=A0A4R5DMX6_9ACTN|nr:ribosomal protein L7/L12 [Jiangella asiatica]TDE12255.1 hypothetical protein E1269_08225 [Jiangella asiatica]